MSRGRSSTHQRARGLQTSRTWRSVREADFFVVWLVGDTTTPPVRDEIAEALAANKRLWAITLPAVERDELTTQLLEDVRGRAKTASANSADELRELLALTFSDEIVRALRDTPGLTRLALVEQVGRRSRARMVSRWVAVGLESAEAVAFADDPAVGAPPERLLPDADQPLSVIVGDVGAGKSVAAERHAEELGDPRLQGAYVVIDGADEVAPDVAARVIARFSRKMS